MIEELKKLQRSRFRTSAERIALSQAINIIEQHERDTSKEKMKVTGGLMIGNPDKVINMVKYKTETTVDLSIDDLKEAIVAQLNSDTHMRGITRWTPDNIHIDAANMPITVKAKVTVG